MSKQLAISAAASVFAMFAFVLLVTPVADPAFGRGGNEAGASAFASAPAGGEAFAGLPFISN